MAVCKDVLIGAIQSHITEQFVVKPREIINQGITYFGRSFGKNKKLKSEAMGMSVFTEGKQRDGRNIF